MLDSNKTTSVAASLIVTNYNDTMAQLKTDTQDSLNAHVNGFMTELRATYPQFEFDFWGDHIKVYDPSIVGDANLDYAYDLVMTVNRFTNLIRVPYRTVGMTAAIVDFLNELGKIEDMMSGVVIELTHNHTPRYALMR